MLLPAPTELDDVSSYFLRVAGILNFCFAVVAYGMSNVSLSE